MTLHDSAAAVRLDREWRTSPRWQDITRRYSATDVSQLQGSLQVQYTLADRGARRLWELLTTQEYVPSLGPGEVERPELLQAARAGSTTRHLLEDYYALRVWRGPHDSKGGDCR